MLITELTAPPDGGDDTELTTERAEEPTYKKKNLPPVVLSGASFSKLPANSTSMNEFNRMA